MGPLRSLKVGISIRSPRNFIIKVSIQGINKPISHLFIRSFVSHKIFIHDPRSSKMSWMNLTIKPNTQLSINNFTMRIVERFFDTDFRMHKLNLLKGIVERILNSLFEILFLLVYGRFSICKLLSQLIHILLKSKNFLLSSQCRSF